jgi:hypothetical protein
MRSFYVLPDGRRRGAIFANDTNGKGAEGRVFAADFWRIDDTRRYVARGCVI